MYLDNSKRHADEIGEQAAFTKNVIQALQKLDGLGVKPGFLVCQNLLKPFCGAIIPCPRVDERLRLRPVLCPNVVVNLVIVSFRVERWIDVAEVYRLRFYVSAKNV